MFFCISEVYFFQRSSFGIPRVKTQANIPELLSESKKQTYLNGFSKYIRLLQSEDREEKLEGVDKLIHSFIDYDSICREIYYQKKIAEIRKENPDKKIFTVFGKAHTDGISKTLQDSNYRTPLPSIAKMKWLMGCI